MIIWKYSLEITDDQILGIPENAKILTAQLQNDVACIWALVNPETHALKKDILELLELVMK